MESQIITVRIPADVLAAVTEEAKAKNTARNRWIVQAAIARLPKAKRETLDELKEPGKPKK